MTIHEYINEDWRAILRHNQAETFERLWQLDRKDWFEPPNSGRGGWSGVVRQEFSLPEGGKTGVFIKFQENHVYRSWKNLFCLSATFEREFRNLQHYRSLGIPTQEPIYFGHRNINGDLRAILVTRELEGYQAFDADCYSPICKLDRTRRKRYFQSVATTLQQMHGCNLMHNGLYLKHIFVRENDDGSVDTRLIDLEKARWRPIKRLIAIRDFGSLHRHASGWSRTDRLRLFLAYRQEARLGKESRKILGSILGRKKSGSVGK